MIKQAIALSWINFKSFPHRLVASSVSMLSIACVAAVILGVLALSSGMIKTMQRTGLDNTLLVMRAGAVSELQSVMFPTEVNILANHSQVVRDQKGQSLVSAEMFVNAEYKRAPALSKALKAAGEQSTAKQSTAKQSAEVAEISLALRGISQNTYAFRPNFSLVSGEKFSTGLRQLIVGQAIARRMPELAVGKTIRLGGSQWRISGVFSDNNSVFESELWADIGTVQSDYQRGNSIQSVRLAMKQGTDLAKLDRQWQQDPRLNVRIIAEKVFFAEQAQNLTRLIRWVGLPIALIMALGATVAALNTMYAAISSRSKEIATHKAIGFTPLAISLSIISEALLLALVGGLLGVIPLYVLFDGWTASAQNANSLSQMMFNFDISPMLMGQAMLLSVVIGLLGGILPALKAMRLQVTVALREN